MAGSTGTTLQTCGVCDRVHAMTKGHVMWPPEGFHSKFCWMLENQWYFFEMQVLFRHTEAAKNKLLQYSGVKEIQNFWGKNLP